MDLKTFRESHGYTQAQMADILQGACPGIDRSLVSKIERGLCLPTAEVSEWLNEACAHGVGERNNEGGISYRQRVENALKSPFWATIYKVCSEHTMDDPATRQMLCIRTGRSDRQVRDAIREMRNNYLLICGSSKGKGYWLCRTDEDFRLLEREYASKTRSSKETLGIIRAAIWEVQRE